MSTLYHGRAYLRKRAQNASKPMRSLITDDIDGARPKRTIRRGRRQQNVAQSLNYMPTSQAHYQPPQMYANDPQRQNSRRDQIMGVSSQAVHKYNPGGDREQYYKKDNNRYKNTEFGQQQYNINGNYNDRLGRDQNIGMGRGSRRMNKQPMGNMDMMNKQQEMRGNNAPNNQVRKMRNPMYADYNTYTTKAQPQVMDSLDMLQHQRQNRQPGSRSSRRGMAMQTPTQNSRRGNNMNMNNMQQNNMGNMKNMSMAQSKMVDRPPRPQIINNQAEMRRNGQQPPQGGAYQRNQSKFYGATPPQGQNRGGRQGGAQGPSDLERNQSAFYGYTKPEQQKGLGRDAEFAQNESKFYDSPMKNKDNFQQKGDFNKAENAFYGVEKKNVQNGPRQRRKQPQKQVRKLQIYNPVSHSNYVDYNTDMKEITNKYDYDQQYLKNMDKFYNVDRVSEKHKIRGNLQAKNLNPRFVSENQSYGQMRRQYV